MLCLIRRSALTICLAAAVASPGWALSDLEIYEASAAPGVTAQFPPGSGLFADIDYDASAAGGGLQGEPTDIQIVPFGGVSFVAFTCEVASCIDGTDYVFTAGSAGTGSLEVHDSRNPPLSGTFDIGTIEFDAIGSGGIQLVSCAYHDSNGDPQSCSSFVLVNVPEPGSAALLGLGLGAVALRRRAAAVRQR